MPGKRRWEKRPYKVLKIKVYADTLERYKERVVSMQTDIEEHIERTAK